MLSPQGVAERIKTFASSNYEIADYLGLSVYYLLGRMDKSEVNR